MTNTAKIVKKLLLSNRYTMEQISAMLSVPIEKCVEEFETFFNTPIPASLFIVGNHEARRKLRTCINGLIPTLLVGPNGVGKTSAIREVAHELELNLRMIYPFNQQEIAEEFGLSIKNSSSKDLFVIEADTLGKKKYSILSTYIEQARRPIILVAEEESSLNTKIVKKCEVIYFAPPSMKDVDIFLKNKYSWNGNIKDIYDPDMRIVLARVFADLGIKKPVIKKKMDAMSMANNLSFGYEKVKDFDKLKDPIWWVIRNLAYNQHTKFRDSASILDNLEKLSFIDLYKFKCDPIYLKYMLVGLKGSPRRSYFKFPPWPKKQKKEDPYNIIKKQKITQPKKEVKVGKFSLRDWL